MEIKKMYVKRFLRTTMNSKESKIFLGRNKNYIKMCMKGKKKKSRCFSLNNLNNITELCVFSIVSRWNCIFFIIWVVVFINNFILFKWGVV